MRVIAAVAAISAFSPTALAHWNYDRLIHNGKIVGDYYTYIRQTTNSNSPITDVASVDMRCNAGGASGAKTQTYTVAAGDEIGFVINVNFGHPGPHGGWTKIYSLTTKAITDQGLQWAGDGMTNFLFKIPAQTPPGEYLVRAEALALHGAGTVGGAQWYLGCAQIKVTGSGSGTPGPNVKIPGVYKGDEPGIKINIYYPTPKNYTVPGPALWPAGTQEQHVAKTL